MIIDENRVNQLNDLSERLGLQFKDIETFNQAFIHPSFSNEYDNNISSNQRLEFLGDSVLELSISDHLYSRYQKLSEGRMTKIRSIVVCETSLAQISADLSLGKYLYLGKGEEVTGGRNKPSILADTFEALIGAIFVDQALPKTHSFIMRNLKATINMAINGSEIRDYKTLLQEKLQGQSDQPIVYEVIDETGPDHLKIFKVRVKWKGNILGEGGGKSKKQAEQWAAKMALESVL